MSIEAMKLALEALEDVQEAYGNHSEWFKQRVDALRAAIEQAEKQEPVAWMFQHEDTGLIDCVDVQQVEWGFEKNNPRWKKVAPLYTAPPQHEWQGLTDEEYEAMAEKHVAFCYFDTLTYAKAIEAKLKEKNT